MKLLLITQDFPPVEGGMARYYADLAAGLGPDVVVSTTSAEGFAGSPAPGLSVHRMEFPLAQAHRLGSLWRWERRLTDLIRQERPDAIICGNLRPLGPLCHRLGRSFGLPCHVIVHGNDLLSAHRRWSGWRRGTWDRVVGEATLCITNSRAVRSLAVERFGVDAARSAVLTPEVDTGRFRPGAPGERAGLRRSLGLPEGPLALFVGRLVARKGLDRLIEAMGETRRGFLAVAGYGDAAPYRSMAAAHGVTDRLRFLGSVDDAMLPDVYRAADFLAMPSRTILDRDDIEGFGIVYLEAAASGLPALAGRSGGAPEAVLHGETGLVVDGDDRGGVRAALERLFAGAGEGGTTNTLGRAARRRVESDFAAGSMARNLRILLAAGRRGGAAPGTVR